MTICCTALQIAYDAAWTATAHAAKRKLDSVGAGADVMHPLQHGLSMILTTERLALNATHRHPECLGCHEVLHMSHGDNIAVAHIDVC